MTVHDLGEHELGAHAVGTADQDRVFHILKRGGREQATKATDTADDLGAVGVLNHLLNSVDGAATLGGIDAGILIRHMLAVAHLSLPLPLPSAARAPNGAHSCVHFGAHPDNARRSINKTAGKTYQNKPVPKWQVLSLAVLLFPAAVVVFLDHGVIVKVQRLIQVAGLKASINLSRPKLSGIATG